MLQKDAALMAGISSTTVNRALADRTGRERATGLASAPLYDSIDKISRVRVASIKSDAVFAAALAHIREHRLNQTEISKLVGDVNARETTAEQLAVIDNDNDNRLEAGNTKVRRRDKDHVPRLRSAIWSVLDVEKPLVKVNNAGRDRARLAESCRRAGLHLLEISEHLAPPAHRCEHCGDTFDQRVHLAQHRLKFHQDAA